MFWGACISFRDDSSDAEFDARLKENLKKLSQANLSGKEVPN